MRGRLDKSYEMEDFYAMIEILRDAESSYIEFGTALLKLIQVVNETYQIPPILLIDEYDQPIMSSYEYGYHEETGTFFQTCMEVR